MMTRTIRPAIVVAMLAALAAGCVARPPVPVATSPRFPEYPMPEVPPSLVVAPVILRRHMDGWQRLQGGDLDGARADLTDALRRAPEFYPAEAALGFVELADREPAAASARFQAALDANPEYLPGWVGQAEALLELGRDAEAISAMERVLTLDPQRESLRARIELVRFRHVQALIDSGRRAYAAGRLDEAREVLTQALDRSPSSTVILHELALIEREAGRLQEAEDYARRAIALESGEPEWQATLGEILEAQGRFADAAEAYERAVALDPRAEWRTRGAGLRRRAELAALPPEFAAIPTAESITRGQAAALVGVRLASLLQQAPVRVTDIATDIRTHWAASWILPVTRAGIMNVFPNHTFQPNAVLSRADLAALSAELLRLALRDRRADLARLQAARPQFADLPPTNVRYPAAALAVAAGVMSVSSDDRFDPSAAASGSDLEAVVQRIEALARG